MGCGTLSKPLTEITKAKFKKYLSDNRNNDEKFSKAMQVLLNQMPPQENWHLPFNSLQNGEKYFTQDNNQ